MTSINGGFDAGRVTPALPRTPSTGTAPAIGALLSLLPPEAKQAIGRMLADLVSGNASPAALNGMGSLAAINQPANVPGSGGAALPPRLGGAPSGNVTVRGQDGSVFPVRDSHVSSPQEAAWALDRVRQLGLDGANAGVQQYKGFYGIDYSQAGDNRIHTIGIGPDEGTSRMNVGLIQEMYRNMPREQADAILACDLKYIQEDARRRAAADA